MESVWQGLAADITTLNGVGDRARATIRRLLGRTRIWDVLCHLPSGITPCVAVDCLRDVQAAGTYQIVLTITGIHKPQKRPQPWTVYAEDGAGSVLKIVYFSGGQYLVPKLYAVGQKKRIAGKFVWDSFHNCWSCSHPEHVLPAGHARLPEQAATYPLTAGLHPQQLARLVRQCLSQIPDVPEVLAPAVITAHSWPSWTAAIQAVHQLEDPQVLDPQSPPRRRLAFEEILARQAALRQARQQRNQNPAPVLRADAALDDAIAGLPFTLTDGQAQAVADIRADLQAGAPMQRLIQGDVGSGKTALAWLAAVMAVGAGYQAVLMAPTEVLAAQHYATLQPLAAQAGVRLLLLTGAQTAKSRKQAYALIATGQVDLIIGTHAVFQDGVVYHQLGVVMIDEQHRFGVRQRLQLLEKAVAAHLLMLTATPIPRTLLMAVAGDLDVSVVAGKPPGRLPIITTTCALTDVVRVVDGVRRALAAGAQVYWVCPLVETSEALELTAALARQEQLQQALGQPVGLIHGQMAAADKEAALGAFTTGEIRLLVATTVIEVGVNVPDATIMVIEHAERFGLSQLHQLRGRVGRGTRQGHCVLLYGSPLGVVAKTRLEQMKQSQDGFYLAEQDLALRGAGDIVGVHQSGLPSLIFADLSAHKDLLELAGAYLDQYGCPDLPPFLWEERDSEMAKA